MRLINKFIYYLFLFLCTLPIIFLPLLSITNNWFYPNILPTEITFKNISYAIFTDKNFLNSILSSIWLGLITVFITIIISIPYSKALTFYDFKGKKFLQLLILLPIIVPAFSIITWIHIFMIKIGLTGTYFGVSLIHSVFALPYAIQILNNTFKIVGQKNEQQAILLGANQFVTFTKITLPLIGKGIVLASIMTFSISLSQYLSTFFIGGGKIPTLSITLIPYIQSGKYELSAIYSFMYIVCTVIIYLIFNLILKLKYKDFYQENIVE